MAALGLAAAVGAGQPTARSAEPPTTGGSTVKQSEIKTVGQTSSADFADEPLSIESIGLTMKIPLGAEVRTERTGGQVSVAMVHREQGWLITIQAPRTRATETTVTQAAELTMKSVLSADGWDGKDIRGNRIADPVTAGRILDRTPNFQIPGIAAAGERFYLTVPGPTKQPVVYGYTLFKIAPDRFLTFQVSAPEANFDKVRRVYELAVATATVQDTEQLSAQRRELVIAGEAFLRRQDEKSFGTLLDQPQRWYRFYKPAASGLPGDAEERGYRGLRFFRGTLAQTDAEAPAGAPSSSNPEGYLAELSARLINRASAGGKLQIIDISGRFFMTPDRKQEAWAVRTAVREEGESPALFTETGTRSAQTMTVIVRAPGRPERVLKPEVPEIGYLNQFEVHAIPSLLAATGLKADFGFYPYLSQTESITLRREEIDPGAAGGPVTRRARARESDGPTVSTHRADGTLVRSVLPDGVVIEPTGLEELLALWRRKDLPTGSR